MKIAVCIKRVPVMEVKFAIGKDGASVDEAGLKYDVNDFDLWAVEAALQLNEKNPGGEVTVLTLGPDAAGEQLRKALSMGADKAVLLKADGQWLDSFAVAEALAAELKAGAYDVIFFGKKSIDADNSATGAMVGELLDLPVVTAVSKLEIAGGKGTAQRAVEGGVETIEFPLPAIVTVDEGLNKERLPSLKGIMAAKKKPLETKPAQLGQAAVSVAKMELPPERAAGRIVGEGASAVPELVKLLQSEAKVL